MAEVSADDGAHPSSEGYGILAKLVPAGGSQDSLRSATPDAKSTAGAPTFDTDDRPPPLAAL
jgi:hypothetical protein